MQMFVGFFPFFAPFLRLHKTGALVLNRRKRRNVTLFATYYFAFTIYRKALDLV